MKIEIITDLKDFESLNETWNGLLKNSRNDIVCLTHEWLVSWWKSFSDTNKLHIVTVSDNARHLIAIAPMMVSDFSYRGIKSRKIFFMANGHSPSTDFILNKDRMKEGVEAITGYLESYADWEFIELQKMDSGGRTFSLLTEYTRHANNLSGLKENIETPYIPLDSGWEAFLGNRSSKFRKVLRNKLNRAEREGDISVEKITSSECDSRVLDDMLNISGKSWKRDIGTDLKSDSQSMAFYGELCRSSNPGRQVNIWFLKKGEERIAFEFHLVYNNVVYPVRADYNKAFKEVSPGSVLEFNILRRLFTEQSLKEYNTCGHTYNYLLNWTDNTRKYMNIEIFGKSLRPCSLYLLEYRVLPVMRRMGLNKIKNLCAKKILHENKKL